MTRSLLWLPSNNLSNKLGEQDNIYRMTMRSGQSCTQWVVTTLTLLQSQWLPEATSFSPLKLSYLNRAFTAGFWEAVSLLHRLPGASILIEVIFPSAICEYVIGFVKSEQWDLIHLVTQLKH